MEAVVYNTSGKQTGTIALPEAVFGAKWNPDLVHQVVVSMQANARKNIAHTKDRGEVSGGGKKPWRQKGTGRARHGSTRSPIWVGGGVTFGPRNERQYAKKINRKMRARALCSALSRKQKDAEVLFIDEIAFPAPRTKDAVALLSALAQASGSAPLAYKKKNAALVLLSKRDAAVAKSFRNIGSVLVEEVRNINPVDVLRYKYVIFERPADAVTFLKRKVSGRDAKKEA